MVPRHMGLALLLVLALTLQGRSAEPENQSGILFITAIDPDQPGIATLIDEARSEIQDHLDRPVHFDVEYLDPFLFNTSRDNEAKATAFMEAKYAHQNFDVIVAIGPPALQFAMKYGPQLFPRAGIMALLLASSAPGPEKAPPPGTTGVLVVLNFLPTLKVALAQNPATREVLLVAGSSPDDRMKLQEAKKEFASYAPKLRFLDVHGSSVDQIKSKVGSLGDESVIIFLDLTADGTGEAYISARMLTAIARAASRPVYGISSEQLEKGIVGGSLIDMREAGRAVGGTAVRVINGEKPGTIPWISAGFQHYMFDARQITRWGIEEVPEGSTVLHLDYDSWARYKWQIAGLSLALFLETLLLMLLLWTFLARRRAERDLARMRTVEELESSLAATLIQLPAEMVNAAIDRGFKRFIDFFGIDCISQFEFLEDLSQFRLLHYRCAPGTRLRMSRLKPEEFTWTANQLLRGEIIVVRAPADLPPEAAGVKSAVLQAGVRSLVGVPLKAADRVFGALFFSSSQEIDWDDGLLGELQLIASLVGHGLERARAQAALTQSERLKSAILASLPSLVAVLDTEGNVTTVNSPEALPAAKACFGSEPLRPGVNYFSLCRRAAEQGSQYAQAALLGLQQVGSRARTHFELEYPSGEPPQESWYHISAVPLIGKQGGVVVSHTDVTRRRLTEMDLEESERRFRLIADSAPVLMWMSGPGKLYTQFNKRWLEFTGNRLEDEIGEGWMQGIHPEDLRKCIATYTSAFDARAPFDMEYRLRHADGQYRWIGDRGVPRFRNDGSFAGYIGCAVDITEQKKTEAVRAEISGRLIRAQEEERARIARELHDDINQKLGLLAIDIQQLQQRLPHLGQPAQEALTGIFDKTNRIAGDVQQLSHQLHSSRLDYLGLAAALRRLCEEFAAQHHISTECVIRELPENLTREINLSFFRVAQECLNNVARHSGARHVRLELHGDDGSEVRMSISDDGAGFSTEQAAERPDPGLGLISMRERLRLVGGELTINSQRDKGANIVAAVPVNRDGSARRNAGSEFLKLTG